METEDVSEIDDHKLTGAELGERYGTWNEHPNYTVTHWAHVAMMNDIRRGYWDWVANELEQNSN